MSLNTYDSSSGTLTNIASGSRIWTGTKEEWAALVQAGKAPTNTIVMITNDEDDTIATEVIKDDSRAVTSGAVYDYLNDKVSVKSDGVKTAKALLNELHNKIDFTKITSKSVMIFGENTLQISMNTKIYTQALIQLSTGKLCIQSATLDSTNSLWRYCVDNSVTDQSSTVVPANVYIHLLY